VNIDKEQEEKLEAVLKKIGKGDGLTDEELELAIDFYKEAEWRLKLLGPHFHLAWREVYFRLTAFEEFKLNRQRNHGRKLK